MDLMPFGGQLEVRYARGEIDRTTYLQMREDLNKRASG
jgi:hypothetical protein